MDFVTRLPCSIGNTVILTIVDRLSKIADFIVLLKLPSAKETAQLLVQHVFHLHGLPVDVLSDRGPQFSCAFWAEFYKPVGTTPVCDLVSTHSSMGRQRGKITIGPLLLPTRWVRKCGSPPSIFHFKCRFIPSSTFPRSSWPV